MKQLFVLLAGFFVFGISAAEAQVAAPGINKSHRQQHRRIKKGAQSGDLTLMEARRLERQQLRIKHAKRHAKADGFFDPAERAQIRAMQRKANRHINRKNHNFRDRDRF